MTNGLVYIHMLQMEKILGRPLNDLEVVHHCNEIRTDYSETNLWCFRSTRDHSAFHMGAIVCISSDGIYYCPSVDIENRCQICNKKLKFSSKYCRSCWDIYIRNRKIYIKKLKDQVEKCLSL